MSITKDQIQAIAYIAVACRPHGAPQWDRIGIEANLAKVRHLAIGDVAMAAIRAASDRTIKTPGAIANTNSTVWATKPAEPTYRGQPATGQACLTCGYWLDLCICGERKQTPGPRGDTKAGIAKARQALREAQQ